MQLITAKIAIQNLPLVAILVGTDQAYPAPGARLVAEAQRHFPTLLIILMSPL